MLLYVYHSGMRRGEFLGLTWEGVDLKGGFIRLNGADTKTSEGCFRDIIPLMRMIFRRPDDGGTPIWTPVGQDRSSNSGNPLKPFGAGVVELVDARDSKSRGGQPSVSVRVRPPAPAKSIIYRRFSHPAMNARWQQLSPFLG